MHLSSRRKLTSCEPSSAFNAGLDRHKVTQLYSRHRHELTLCDSITLSTRDFRPENFHRFVKAASCQSISVWIIVQGPYIVSWVWYDVVQRLRER